MAFDRNQTEFKDILQEAAWELGIRQVPLEITISYVPDELKSACTDLHGFTSYLIADMYENHEHYGLESDSSLSYEENRVRVEFYFNFLSGLLKVKGMNLVNNNYEIPADVFQKYIKKFNIKSIKALKKHGLTYEKKDDAIIISNQLYPAMLIAFKAMFEAANKNYKYNSAQYVLYNDFRALVKYKRTYEDALLVLNDKNRQIAEEINNYCVSRNILQRKSIHYNRVVYEQKTKMKARNPLLQGLVYTLEIADKNQLQIYVEAGYEAFNIVEDENGVKMFMIIEEEVKKFDEAEGFKELWRKTLRQCKGCNSNCWHFSRPVKLFGKKMNVCQNYLMILEPDKNILKHIFQLIDFRVKVLSNGGVQPSISWSDERYNKYLDYSDFTLK